jgi:hypothetical protein
MAERRKALEGAFCARVAERLNAMENTDYRAVAIDRKDEIADVVLVSASRSHPNRRAQAVTIPSDLQLREDTDSARRLGDRLRGALETHGVRHGFVTVRLTRQGRRSGLRVDLVDDLARLVQQGGDSEAIHWGDTDVWEYSEELSDYVGSVSLYRLPEVEGIHISIPLVAYVPSDGRWINEVIDRKLTRYGNADSVEDIMLVIGALGLVHGGQIASFREGTAGEELPFGEIWLVSGFEGVIRLKARRV